MYPLPQGIPTFVTIPELRLLQRYAHDADNVLEIGTQYGYTAIGMALAGAHVTSVDPHDQGSDGGDTWEPFLANCVRHGFELVGLDGPTQGVHADTAALGQPLRVAAFRQSIEDWHGDQERCPWLPEQDGLVFIDGDHAYEAVRRDFEIAAAHLCEPRWVAFHDVTPRSPGVWRATRELEREGRIAKLEQVGVLAVYRAL